MQSCQRSEGSLYSESLSSMLHVHDGKLFSVNDYVELGVINTLVHLEPTIVVFYEPKRSKVHFLLLN